MGRKTKYISILIIFIALYFGEITISSSNKGDTISNSQKPTTINLPFKIDNSFSHYEGMIDFENDFQKFLNTWKIKGASVAIVKDGKMLYAKGFGYANAEEKIETQPYHLFRVASISKLITAVTIMHLQEKGVISLSDKVFGENGILNDATFLTYKDKSVENITIENLLNHSGGWGLRRGDPPFMIQTIATKMNCSLPISQDTLIAYSLRYNRLNFKPGTRSCYSNLGYIILGKVIEKVTQQRYEQYVKNEILAPIGIDDMYIGESFYNRKNALEVKYYNDGEDKIDVAYDGSGEFVPKQYGGNDIQLLGAAGGWVASSVSLAKLLVSVDGFSTKADILKLESIDKMTRHSNTLNPLGWKGTKDNLWWRTGTLEGTSTMMARCPDGTAWIVLLNTSTWKGARFTSYIAHTMNTELARINDFPTNDLFFFDNTKALLPSSLSLN